MPMLDRDGQVAPAWTIAAPDDPVVPAGPVLLDLARFRAGTGRGGPTGVVLDTTAPHAVLAEVAPRAAAIGIRFPLFRDGRGFTLVRQLRERLGYAGPVIALGHVLPDQWPLLRALGASFVLVPDGANLAAWRRADGRAAAPYRQHLLPDSRDLAGAPA